MTYPFFMTESDVKAYRGQKQDILRHLGQNFGKWVSTAELESVSGSKRVAARILTLRDDLWDIAVRRSPNGRTGEYSLQGKVESRNKRKHCPSCSCDLYVGNGIVEWANQNSTTFGTH